MTPGSSRPISAQEGVAQMLNVTNMNVYYGNIYAVKDVSFHVEEGEVVTLIGANGAGKSTILQTISGLLRSKTGAISFAGEEIGSTPSHAIVKRGLAQVPEGRRVFLQMSVQENLEMGHYTQPGGTMHERIAEVYDRFPRLKERNKQHAGTLSGGEQQMLAIGRALMLNPSLLLLDEPLEGLAPVIIDRLLAALLQLRDEGGMAIVLVEQHARLALEFSPRAVIMDRGKVAHDGASRGLLEDPQRLAELIGVGKEY